MTSLPENFKFEDSRSRRKVSDDYDDEAMKLLDTHPGAEASNDVQFES